MAKKGIKHTLEHNIKISKSMMGERNGNFKGYKISIVSRLRESRLWKNVKNIIRKRDGNKCVFCGKGGKCKECGHTNLHVDHIEKATPENFFDLSNLRTLCKKCHEETETFGAKANLKHGKR